MPVYWLMRRQTRVRSDPDWLSVEERAALADLRFEKRRNDWLLGRWTAKQAVQRALPLLGTELGGECGPALSRISILAASDGAPEVLLDNRPCGVNLSISHCGGVAMCAAARQPLRLGCDLERIEPRSRAFVEDFFTEAERDWWLRQPERWRPLSANLVWSAKESALKVLRTGLRADTRSVEVNLADLQPQAQSAWRPLRTSLAGGKRLEGWWRTEGERLVQTVFITPSAPQPVQLE